ncbi:hypothetical protein NPIL_65901 [Nephila pilipes]|uniref:Uncharacterized protein n=1 Tax=Nephila pilipes TaxID=299642 RepID=A0A8X6QT21_NEPPI|nr:hypothetical protein NPIL_65901 [Nephila pilipes]
MTHSTPGLVHLHSLYLTLISTVDFRNDPTGEAGPEVNNSMFDLRLWLSDGRSLCLLQANIGHGEMRRTAPQNLMAPMRLN